MLDQITPVLLTYNEASNLPRTLAALHWAERIVVIDSYSGDETLKILKTYPQVEVFQRSFDTHAQQWNYGIEQVATDWVLSLDADYIVVPALLEELKQLQPDPQLNSYWIRFRYCVFGQPLSGTLLPPRQALFRTYQGRYIDDGHTQRLQIQGASRTLVHPLWHDDRKTLQRWLWAQDRYAVLEAQKLQQTPTASLSLGDRLRRDTPFAPLAVLLYCLLLKGGLWDGPAGLYYAAQRCVAELILLLHRLKSIETDSGALDSNPGSSVHS